MKEAWKEIKVRCVRCGRTAKYQPIGKKAYCNCGGEMKEEKRGKAE